MFKLNTKTIFLAMFIFALASFGLTFGWYATIHSAVSGVATLNAWTWICLILWPALTVVLCIVCMFVKNIKFIEFSGIIVFVLMVVGYVFLITSGKVQTNIHAVSVLTKTEVNVNTDAFFFSAGIVDALVLICSGTLTMFFIRNKGKVAAVAQTKSIVDDEILEEEDILA